MAARRSSGTTGMAVGLVIFVILFILSLVAAILMYTQNSAALAEKEAALAEKARYVSPKDEDDPIIRGLREKGGDPSPMKQLVTENSNLKQRLIGNPTASYEQVDQALRAALKTADKVGGQAGDALVALLEKAIANCESAVKAAGTAKAGEDALKGELAKAELAKKKAIDDYEKAAKELATAIPGLQAQLKTQDEAWKKKYEELEGTTKAQLDAAKKAVEEREGTIAARDQMVKDLNRRVDELLAQIPKPKERLQPERMADGRIVSVLASERVATINLGRKHRMILGLTFEVFDPKKGVTVDEVDKRSIRGKATIEVIRVDETSSVARIVRMERAAPPLEGDLVANVVYDPNIRYKFHTYGDFDLDNVGSTSASDKRRIHGMITEWGGVLTDKLTPDTDFLVLGVEPTLPDPPAPGELDTTKIEKYAAAKKDWETYQRLQGEARTLKIPILNQNKFLMLVGYYQR